MNYKKVLSVEEKERHIEVTAHGLTEKLFT